MDILLSPLFLYTFAGILLASFGIVLAIFYNRRWTRLLRLITSLAGAVLLMCNTSNTVWDVVVAVSASVVVTMGVFFIFVAFVAFGIVRSERTFALAMRLGLVEYEES